MNPTFPLVPIANSLACILLLLSFSKSMIKTWNVGACAVAMWTSCTAFITVVNTILWSDNIRNVAPIWCDITTHIQFGSFTAIPAASFVIVKKVHTVTRQNGIDPVKRDRTGLVTDLLLCFGCPMINTALYFIVQTHRYRIVEEVGCLQASGDFGLAMLLLFWPSLLFALASLSYYPSIIRACLKHKKELKMGLASGSSLSRQGISRFLILGYVDFILIPPQLVAILILIALKSKHVPFWPEWKAVHVDFASISTLTSGEWRTAGFWTRFGLIIGQWADVAKAVGFFALFGITEQKRARYKKAFWKVAKPFGLVPRSNQKASIMVFATGAGPALPVSTEMDETSSPTSTDQSLIFSNTSSERRASYEGSTDMDLEEGRCEEWQ